MAFRPFRFTYIDMQLWVLSGHFFLVVVFIVFLLSFFSCLLFIFHVCCPLFSKIYYWNVRRFFSKGECTGCTAHSVQQHTKTLSALYAVMCKCASFAFNEAKNKLSKKLMQEFNWPNVYVCVFVWTVDCWASWLWVLCRLDGAYGSRERVTCTPNNTFRLEWVFVFFLLPRLLSLVKDKDCKITT